MEKAEGFADILANSILFNSISKNTEEFKGKEPQNENTGRG
jgi:hypothetical protein